MNFEKIYKKLNEEYEIDKEVLNGLDDKNDVLEDNIDRSKYSVEGQKSYE